MAWWWKSKRSDTASAKAEAPSRPAPIHRLRPIEARDDAALAHVVRTVMSEFGVADDGSAARDPNVDAMSSAYSGPRTAYFVVENQGRIVGGAGIGPLLQAPFDTCELRRMYLLREVRGYGTGARLLRQCLRAARGFGYRVCYLETHTDMNAAHRLYAKAGFRPRKAPLGAAGHFGCDRYFALDL